MNEKQASERGYGNTHSYDRNYDKIEEKRDELRKKGYKAVIVKIPDNPLSRGPIGCGWSVYVERRYLVEKEIEDLRMRLEGIENRKEYARKNYETELERIEEMRNSLQKRLYDLESEGDKIRDNGHM
jgi:hypothetical protein